MQFLGSQKQYDCQVNKLDPLIKDFMYLHSLLALKMPDKNNQTRFQKRFSRFGGDGDKLDNIQDRSILYDF